MAKETVVPTPLGGLRPVGDGTFSVLDADGTLLPGLTWERDARGRHEGYSLVTNGQSRWAVDDDGKMMFGY